MNEFQIKMKESLSHRDEKKLKIAISAQAMVVLIIHFLITSPSLLVVVLSALTVSIPLVITLQFKKLVAAIVAASITIPMLSIFVGWLMTHVKLAMMTFGFS